MVAINPNHDYTPPRGENPIVRELHPDLVRILFLAYIDERGSRTWTDDEEEEYEELVAKITESLERYDE